MNKTIPKLVRSLIPRELIMNNMHRELKQRHIFPIQLHMRRKNPSVKINDKHPTFLVLI